MARLVRILLASALVSLVAVSGELSLPKPVVACSCIQPPTLAEVPTERPDNSIFAGRVQRDRGDGTVDFNVERWFFGPNPRPVVVLDTGNTVGPGGVVGVSSCGVNLQVGLALILAAGRDEKGRYAPTLCSHYGRLDEAEGQALLKEAEAAFGAGQTLPTPEAEPEAPATPLGDARLAPDAAVIAAVGFVGLVAVGLFGAVAIAGRRRRTDG